MGRRNFRFVILSFEPLNLIRISSFELRIYSVVLSAAHSLVTILIMKRHLLALVCVLLVAVLTGCESHILPLRPLQRVQMWVPDDGSNAFPLSEEADDRELPPGQEITRVIDPNQTARYIYNASYDNIWEQSMLLVARAGFTIDRKDYRQGVITTQALPSAQFIEFWKPQHTTPTNAMENTINSQRRYVRVTIDAVPGQSKFYEVAVQVLVERETNPTEMLAGPMFIEGSGFGRNAITLRSDYADASMKTPATQAGGITPSDPNRRWILIGHDLDLERKLLNQIFERNGYAVQN